MESIHIKRKNCVARTRFSLQCNRESILGLFAIRRRFSDVSAYGERYSIREFKSTGF